MFRRGVTTLLAAAFLPGFADSAQWPQFQCNAANQGRSGGPAVEPPYRLRWIWYGRNNVVFTGDKSIPIGGNAPKPPKDTYAKLSFTMQAVTANRCVYFGDLDGRMYCLAANDGATVWEAKLGGSVVHASAFHHGRSRGKDLVLTACHDGRMYGLVWKNGHVWWTVRARKPFVTPVKLADGVAYAGSLDGKMYAVRAADGKLLWTFDAAAPIRQPAAVAAGKVFFGSEDMIFHALDAKTGKEIWRTARGRMKGQSFRNTWPVVVGDKVMTFQILVDGHAEFVMETLLWHATPGDHKHKRIEDWPKERRAILKWLQGDTTYSYEVYHPWEATPGKRRSDRISPAQVGGPFRKTFFVFNVDGDGKGHAVEPYQVPMGIVGGTGNGNMGPVLDARGRPATYWRVSAATIMKGGSFGTAFTPDLSAMDLKTGDRIPYRGTSRRGPGVELDNHHMLSAAGDYIYWFNPFRGARWIRIDGKGNPSGNVSAVYRRHDGGGWRGDVVYFENAGESGRRGVDTHGSARTPIVIADDALFLNELDIRAFACFESRRKRP